MTGVQGRRGQCADAVVAGGGRGGGTVAVTPHQKRCVAVRNGRVRGAPDGAPILIDAARHDPECGRWRRQVQESQQRLARRSRPDRSRQEPTANVIRCARRQARRVRGFVRADLQLHVRARVELFRQRVVTSAVGVRLQSENCAILIIRVSGGALGFVIGVQRKTVVILGVVQYAGGAGGGLDVGHKVAVAGLEVVLRISLTGVFDDLEPEKDELSDY